VTAGRASTLTLTADAGASVPLTIFTVRGAATSGAHTATAQIAVTAPPTNDFSVAVSPAAATVPPGPSRTFTVTTAVVSGSAQTINLSVAGLPAGVTGGLSPTAVTAGQTATLTVSAGAGASPGTATFTVSGAAASGTRVAMADLTVGPPPLAELIANGGFETGDTSGWAVDAGQVYVSSVAHHGGTHSARVPDTQSLVDDNELYQAIDVPAAGTTTLTFWLLPRCKSPYLGDQYVTLYSSLPLRASSIIADLYTDCADRDWFETTYDLTPFAGERIYLAFEVYDVFGATWMYVDDVSVMNRP
jgi:hypothetical protein